MTVEVAVTRKLAVSAQQAWDALVDWPAQRHWMPLTRVMVDDNGNDLSGAGHHVGARFVARTGWGPLGFDDPMEISHWDPPSRCEVIHHGRVVRGVGWFDVRARDERRCVVTWGERLELPFGTAVLQIGMRIALRRFARYFGG